MALGGGRRVGPLRALLASHALATRNRIGRDMGRSGKWGFVVALGLVLGTAVLPIVLGLAASGYAIGLFLPEPVPVAILGGLLSALALFGGAVSGTLGGTRQLAWESYRVYPLRLATVYVAELVAGIGDVVPVLIGLALASLLVGLAIGRPVLAPIVPLLWAEAMAFVLVLQVLVGSLAASLVRRMRLALVVVALLAWLGSTVPAMLTPGFGAGDGDVKLDPEQLAKLTEIGRALRHGIGLLPTGALARSLAALLERRWAAAAFLHVYPVATLAGLSLVAANLLARDAGREGGPAATRGDRVRLWTFASPVIGVAKLHARALLESNVGRFGLVMPLITIFFVKGPFAHAVGRAAWVVPASFSYVALGGMQFQMSLFGLDGHGAKGLFLLPIRGEDILTGKIVGLALYQGIQAVMLTALLGAFQRPGAGALAGGFLLATSYFLAQVAIGQFTSVWMPRAIPRRGARKAGMPLPLLFVGIASWSALSFGVGGVYTSVAREAPALLVPVMGALAVAWALVLVLLRPRAARYLDENRERVVEAMS